MQSANAETGTSFIAMFGGTQAMVSSAVKGGIQGLHFADTVIASTAPWKAICASASLLTIRFYTHRVKTGFRCLYGNPDSIGCIGCRQFLEQQHAVHLHGLFT